MSTNVTRARRPRPRRRWPETSGVYACCARAAGMDWLRRKLHASTAPSLSGADHADAAAREHCALSQPRAGVVPAHDTASAVLPAQGAGAASPSRARSPTLVLLPLSDRTPPGADQPAAARDAAAAARPLMQPAVVQGAAEQTSPAGAAHAGSPTQLPPLPLRASPRLPARPVERPAACKRTVAEMRAFADAQWLRAGQAQPELPKYFPRGPWPSDDLAKAEIKTWCADPKHGGGFGVIWGSLDKVVLEGRQHRGARHHLCCHKLKDGCKWRMVLEDCVEGWAVVSHANHSSVDAHSHPLVLSRAEANAYAVMREIPADLLTIAKTLVAAGVRVSEADRWLRYSVEKAGGEVTWTYQDVYRQTCATTAERKLDATDMLELLRQRQQEQGLFYRTTTDSEGCLNKVFFAMAGAHDIYAVDAERQVVEFDTKVRNAARLELCPCAALPPALHRAALGVPALTCLAPLQFGTNNAGLKMGLWVSVDGTFATKILACSLLLDETEESFQWASECFKDCFRVPPAVIFTDSDPAIQRAIGTVFPDAKNLLCVYHLAKNLVSNVRPACGSDDELWHRFQSKWWQILLETDALSRATFEAEWVELTEMLPPRANTARTWLGKMAANRERWAYRWTWQNLSMGIHSTQRIEAVHSAIAGFLRASMLLTALVPALDSYGANVAGRAETRAYRHALLSQTAAKCDAHPLTNAALAIVTPAALVLVKAQLQQAPFYIVTDSETPGTYLVTRMPGNTATAPASSTTRAAGDEEAANVDVGLVSSRATPRRTTFDTCSCQYPDCYGLPCRHILQLFILKKQGEAVPEAMFNIRWRQLKPEQLHAFTAALLKRRPPRRAAAAAEGALTRDDRYALIMGMCRGVADLGATSDELFTECRASLTHLMAAMRKPGFAARAQSDVAALQARDVAGAAARPKRGRANVAAALRALPGTGTVALDAGWGDTDDDEDDLAVARKRARTAVRGAAAEGVAGEGEQCRACWRFGHRKTNRRCPRFGMPPLPRPGLGRLGPASRTVAGRRDFLGSAGSGSESDADGGDSDGSGSGENDQVCQKCSETGRLVCCSECPSSWHDTEKCMPTDAMPRSVVHWLCPWCTGSTEPVGFVGNPQQPPHKGSRQRARRRSAAEGTRAQVAQAKKARRKERYR